MRVRLSNPYDLQQQCGSHVARGAGQAPVTLSTLPTGSTNGCSSCLSSGVSCLACEVWACSSKYHTGSRLAVPCPVGITVPTTVPVQVADRALIYGQARWPTAWAQGQRTCSLSTTLSASCSAAALPSPADAADECKLCCTPAAAPAVAAAAAAPMGLGGCPPGGCEAGPAPGPSACAWHLATGPGADHCRARRLLMLFCTGTAVNCCVMRRELWQQRRRASRPAMAMGVLLGRADAIAVRNGFVCTAEP